MAARARSADYTAVAIVLHWAIALAIAAMIPLGWWMADAIKDPATQAQAFHAFQLHKSIGLTILALSVARLGWRFANPPPPLPEGPAWQRAAAHVTHGVLYALMIGAPLGGWLYVSTGYTQDGQRLEVPTSYFGLFEVPHLPVPQSPELASAIMSGHSAAAWAFIVLGAVHVGAALKHQFVDKDNGLGRMVPGIAPPAQPSAGRRAGLVAGFAAIALAAAALTATFLTAGQPEPVEPQTPVAAVTQAAPPAPEAQLAPVAAQPAAPETAPPASTTAAPEASPAAPAEAPSWTIDKAASTVGFSGRHAGAAFEGAFQRFDADIRFAPDALATSRARVTFETASAKTGDGTRDGALPGEEWFNARAHPTATFEASDFRSLGGGRFEARGVLTIKGQRTPVTLPFTFSETGGVARVAGSLTLDRIALGMGLDSDPKAEWVSREIIVSIDLRARRS